MKINFETTTHRAIVDTITGQILAYEKGPQHRQIKANTGDKCNLFGFTTVDQIIAAAKQAMKVGKTA